MVCSPKGLANIHNVNLQLHQQHKNFLKPGGMLFMAGNIWSNNETQQPLKRQNI